MRFPLTCSKSIGKMHADIYITEMYTSLVSRDSPRERNTNKNGMVHALVSVSIAGEDFPRTRTAKKMSFLSKRLFFRWTRSFGLQTRMLFQIAIIRFIFVPRHEVFEIEKKQEEVKPLQRKRFSNSEYVYLYKLV